MLDLLFIYHLLLCVCIAPYARLGLPPGYPETEATGDQKLGIIIKELHEQGTACRPRFIY